MNAEYRIRLYLSQGYQTEPSGLPNPPPTSVGGPAVGWNINQIADAPAAAPYPTGEHGVSGAPGSGWGSSNPSAPPPPYSPPPYTQ